MNLLKKDLKRLPMLFGGFILLALGIYLTKLSTLGMSSWSVFHDGLSITLIKAFNYEWLTFGVMTQGIGLLILIPSIIFLKTKVGIGTILNVIFVGMFYDIIKLLMPQEVEGIFLKIIILIAGVLLTTFGRSLYIASKLGPGPRDGLFVGLARITKINVRIVKPFIEFIVLGAGIYLGGESGFGTVLIIVVSGYLVQFFFKVLKFDPKSEIQSNIMDYFDKK